MEKPFLTLTSKDFLTGLSSGAHIGAGGIFYKADGITPLFEAGVAQSAKNGLLMAGGTATTIAGSLNGTVISGTKYTGTSNTTAYFGTHTSHIFSLVLDSALSNTLSDAHTATSLRQGMEIFTGANGGSMLFYFMDTAIGKFDLNATWNDSWATLSSDDIHATHRFLDRLYFGNSGYVGQIMDDGSGLATSGSANLNKTALAVGSKGNITDISDDGVYLVVATSRNYTCDPNALSGCTILFWDTYSTSWNREYHIPDPFIYALEHTPEGVFAYGVTGIWQVSFSREPIRVLSRSTGIYSTQVASALKYGRGAASHYGDSLLWGGTSGSNVAIKTLGKLDISAPSANLHPFLSTANKNVTYVDGQVEKGWVIVGDDTPQLKGYPISSTATPNTGVTAQTVYLSAPGKVALNRIDAIFGEPLASGDSFSVGIYTDQQASVKTYGTASYAADGAKHRKSMFGSAEIDHQFSVLLTYTSGAVKLKALEFYGDAETP